MKFAALSLALIFLVVFGVALLAAQVLAPMHQLQGALT